MTKGIEKSAKGTMKTNKYQSTLTLALKICFINDLYSDLSFLGCILSKAPSVGPNPPIIKSIINIGCPYLISVIVVVIARAPHITQDIMKESNKYLTSFVMKFISLLKSTGARILVFLPQLRNTEKTYSSKLWHFKKGKATSYAIHHTISGYP